MNFILRLKHWQVFLIFFVASFASNFTYVGEVFITSIINLIGLIIYFFWYFVVGLELCEHLSPRIESSRTLFIINSIVLLLSICAVIVVFNGQYSAEGILGFIWVIWVFYALFQFIFYPAKTLRTIELNEKAGFSEYGKYGIMTIFWPFGIWWFQPKLNKIAKGNIG